MKITKIIECTRVPVGHHGTLNISAMLQKHNDKCQMFVYFDYTNVCYSRFKSSLELMLCVIDISTLNKTYLIWFD
jgi:hypothetical protein